MSEDDIDFTNAVSAAYTNAAVGYAGSWPVPHPWLEIAREQIRAFYPPGSTFLDVGCGHGVEAACWARAGYRVVAIDSSPAMIALAKQTVSNVTFHECGWEAIDCLEEKFDVIWCSYVLLHLPKTVVRNVVALTSAALNHSGSVMLATSIAEATQQVNAPIAGLVGQSGSELKVPAVHWNLDELRGLIRPYLVETWFEESQPVADRGLSYAGIWASDVSTSQSLRPVRRR
jgi:2-polyprenyl-3-methyl-5-hydroxy-6-metoxy-1,4-benzoquinol methylase